MVDLGLVVWYNRGIDKEGVENMGHFYGTCNLSNLPIFEGNKIVVIPLISADAEPVSNCCYPTDNFVPFGFPIVGEYNEYGGILEPDTIEANKHFLMSQVYYKRNCNVDCDKDEKYRKINNPEFFEEFLNEVICKTENIYVATDDTILHPSGYAQVTFMMVHYDLYQQIIEASSFKRVCNDGDFQWNKLHEKYANVLHKYQHMLSENGFVAKNAHVNKEELEELLNKLKQLLSQRIVLEILCDGNLGFQSEHLNYFANILLEKTDFYDDVLEKAIEQTLFIDSMDAMRKGYLCDCGYGSQNSDMSLHLIIANFILKFAAENKK